MSDERNGLTAEIDDLRKQIEVLTKAVEKLERENSNLYDRDYWREQTKEADRD